VLRDAASAILMGLVSEKLLAASTTSFVATATTSGGGRESTQHMIGQCVAISRHTRRPRGETPTKNAERFRGDPG